VHRENFLWQPGIAVLSLYDFVAPKLFSWEYAAQFFKGAEKRVIDDAGRI
jgi:hypothetical protein